MNRNEMRNALFGEDYRVLDLWPRQVSSSDNSFVQEAEGYFFQDKQLQEFYARTAAVVLKVLCYYPFEIYVEEYYPLNSRREGWLKDKRCETILKILKRVILKKKGQMDILLGKESSILSIEGGRLSLAVYHESDSLGRLLDDIAKTEGFYCWRYRV